MSPHSGSDVFKYTSASDTGVGVGNRDKIHDFDAGTSTSSVDKIDLTAFINSDFAFLGTGDFAAGGTIAQVRVESNPGSSLIQIDVDADAVVDNEIQLAGNDGSNLDLTDFNSGT